MDLKYTANLFLVIFGSLALAKLFAYKKSNPWQLIFYYSFIVGLIIYSGIAAANAAMPYYYIYFYFGFLFAFVAAFYVFSKLFSHIGNSATRGLNAGLVNFEISNKWILILFAYLLLHFVPLIFPVLRLNLLFSPNPPDLLSSFLGRFEVQNINFFVKISEYLILLLSPFFYIALFRYRDKLYRVFLLLLFLFYLQYTNIGYKSRGEFLVMIGTFFLALWLYRPEIRKYLAVGGALAAPFVLSLFSIYEYVRVGASVVDLGLFGSVEYILSSETELPLTIGIPLIESNVHANLISYFTWIFTLPIPKFITGEISGFRITQEISEIVLGVNRGTLGFYIVLPGLVAESYYIYGKYFFWLHGVFIGALLAFISKILQRVSQLLFLNSFLSMLILYNLNRSGVGAFLPQIINQLLLFYVFIFINLIKNNKVAKFSSY